MSKRTEKISCDISKEAKQALIAYGLKHERSQGHLINRMILNFCAGEVKAVAEVKPKKPVKRFVPPTVEQVQEYCAQRCYNVNAQEFVAHYTANGCRLGKAKIKDWKACVITWEKNSKSSSNGLSKITQQNLNNLEGDY